MKQQVYDNRDWYIGQIMNMYSLDQNTAAQKADIVLSSLFNGWHDPLLRRTIASDQVVEEKGVPLRAMVTYLFAEVSAANIVDY